MHGVNSVTCVLNYLLKENKSMPIVYGPILDERIYMSKNDMTGSERFRFTAHIALPAFFRRDYFPFKNWPYVVVLFWIRTESCQNHY